MATMRCAYFGCIHPLFESDDRRRKYCSEECAKKGYSKSANQRGHQAKSQAKAVAAMTPEEKRLRRGQKAQSAYRYSSLHDLPPWAKS